MSKMYSVVSLKQTSKKVIHMNDKVVSNRDNKMVSNRDYQKGIHKKRQNLKRISTRDQNKPAYQRQMKKLEKFISQNMKYQGRTRPVKSKRVTKDGRSVTVFSMKINLPQEQPSVWAIKTFYQDDQIVYHEKPKPAESFNVLVGIYDQGKLYCMRTRKFRMPTKYDKVYDPNDIISIKDSSFCSSCEKWYKNPVSDRCFCDTRLRKRTRVCHRDNSEFDDDYLLEQTYIKEIQYHCVPTRRRRSHTSTISEFVPQHTTNSTIDENDTVPLDTQKTTGIVIELESKSRFLGRRCTIKQIGKYKMSLDPENQTALQTLVYNSTDDPECNIHDIEISINEVKTAQTQPDLYQNDPEEIRKELVNSSDLSQSELEILDRNYNDLDYIDRNKFWNIVIKARQNQKLSNTVHKLVQE